MGDADLPHQGMIRHARDEDTDFDDRLDEFQENLEEELDIVYDMFDVLETRIKSLTKYAKSQNSMWDSFVAFNLLVVPIVLALAFAFFTSELDLIEELMIFRQVTITGLVLCSTVIGIPFYLKSLWRLHNLQNKEVHVSTKSFYSTLMNDEGEEGDVESDGSPRSDETEFSSSSSESQRNILRQTESQFENIGLVLGESTVQEIPT